MNYYYSQLRPTTACRLRRIIVDPIVKTATLPFISECIMPIEPNAFLNNKQYQEFYLRESDEASYRYKP